MYLSILWWSVLGAVAAYLIRRFDLLSHFFNAILRLCYPIYEIETGHPLPTLPYVFPNGQGNIEKYLNGRENSRKWNAEYGSLYRIWSGFSGEVVVTQPSDVEIVFRDSHTHHKAIANDSGYLMHQLLGDCLGLISGGEWKALRKATDPPFLRTATATYADITETHAKDHVRSVLNTKSAINGQIHPYTDLRIYPFIVLADILYGPLTPDLKERLLEIIPGRDYVFRAMVQGGISRYSISQFLPIKPMRELRKFKADWAAWNDDAHAEEVKRNNSGEKSGKPAPIVELYASVESGNVTREQVLQTLDEMLFANLDVSIATLAWSLVFLAAYPNTQDQLLEEIKAKYIPDNDRSYLLSQSTYLHHVLLEAGRLRPPAPFSVSQSCPTPRQLGNYVFPAGTKFALDAYQLNVWNHLWAPDNTTFRPERWAEGGVKRAKDIRYCYWRFGFGPRVCLGRHVVDLMIKALLIELVVGWELKLETETGAPWVWDEQNNWTLDPAIRIARVKREG